MIESRRSLAVQTAAFLLVILFVVIVVPVLDKR
jgi:type II secretory pathway component PulM